MVPPILHPDSDGLAADEQKTEGREKKNTPWKAGVEQIHSIH